LSPTISRLGLWPAALLVAALAGCNSNRTAPPLSPQSIGAQAMAAYDSNKDGTLDAKELAQCPSLKSLADKLGKANRLTADDLNQRLNAYMQSGASRVTFTCTVLLDGQPLGGASVTFVPESFMGSSYQPMTANTNDAGEVTPVSAGGPAGILLGFYRIEVSKKNASGQEILPAKYNTQTTLGQEIGPDGGNRSSGSSQVLRLSSK
jgi:hypothetical protein